jgi:hypothetical protein
VLRAADENDVAWEAFGGLLPESLIFPFIVRPLTGLVFEPLQMTFAKVFVLIVVSLRRLRFVKI